MASIRSLAALALPAVTVAAPLIVGGTGAAEGEFPYIVSLSERGSHFCGGLLINANTVLTAAHCSVDTSADAVKVRAGSLEWSSGGVQVGVSEIVVNPNYDAQLTNEDIALWHLSTPIDADDSGSIGYATLPEQGSDPAVGSDATVAGWGVTSEGSQSIPSSLLKVTVPIIDRDECEKDYGSGSITENMFCAGFSEGGKDSCSGDSGGPIVDSQTGTLIGTVSFGQGCAEAGFPGVYARVGQYVDYIKSNSWSS